MAVCTIQLDAVPQSECCVCVSEDRYVEKATRQCEIYILQLRRYFGPEPPGSRLSAIRVAHHYGDFYVVGVTFDDSDIDAAAYSARLEAALPLHWDAETRARHIHEGWRGT
jgi:hypothetical protein